VLFCIALWCGGRLLALDAMQSGEDQDNTAECAEPRPVERGARLVTSVEGGAKVVMQLPRGNLECIEPRPLILCQAQRLLETNQLLECIVLLRKQRVDLNYITDYNPRIFMENVEPLTLAMMRTNHDLISLLVTALEPVDVTVHKYPLYVTNQCDRAAINAQRFVEGFVGENKVNMVCTAIRNVLLPLLYAARFDTSVADTTAAGAGAGAGAGGKAAVRAVAHASIDEVKCSKLLQPILCTYARQRPPRLEEALQLIQLCCTAGGVLVLPVKNSQLGSTGAATATTTAAAAPPAEEEDGEAEEGGFPFFRGSEEDVAAVAVAAEETADTRPDAPGATAGTTTATAVAAATAATSAAVEGGTVNLTSSMAQISIKYLAFLAEGSLLFDSAIGMCDFDVARAVARQCQMDPKVTLPLLESFASIGRGFGEGSPQVALMHFRANMHLQRHTQAVDWCLALLSRMHTAAASAAAAADADSQPDVLPPKEAIEQAVSDLKSVVKSEDLYAYAIPKVSHVSLRLTPAGSAAAAGDAYRQLLDKLLSDLRLLFGLKCASSMQYSEAIASIMATRPMAALEAVEVCRQMGNWQLALSIAGNILECCSACDHRLLKLLYKFIAIVFSLILLNSPHLFCCVSIGGGSFSLLCHRSVPERRALQRQPRDGPRAHRPGDRQRVPREPGARRDLRQPRR
jgi:hypothetical protein